MLRRPFRHSISWLFVLSFAAVLALTASPAQSVQMGGKGFMPGPAGHENLREAYESFSRMLLQGHATNVEDDRVGGNDRDRWYSDEFNADVRTLLADYAASVYQQPGSPTPGQMLGRGRDLLSRGCREPMVLSIVADLLLNRDELGHAEGIADAAVAGIDQTYYSDRVKADPYMIRGVIADRLEDEQTRDEMLKQAAVHVFRAVETGQYNSIAERRALTRTLRDIVTIGSDALGKAVVDKSKRTERMDAVTYHTVAGTLRLKRGMTYGDGLGLASFTKDDWSEIEDDMRSARLHFEKAHEKAPNRPEAASAMLFLCLYGEQPMGTTVFHWLEAAMKAEIDHAGAISNTVFALGARFGGDPRLQGAIADMCFGYGRYDTDLPYHFVRSISVMHADEVIDMTALLQDHELYEQMIEALDTMIDSDHHSFRRDELKAARVAVALQAGRRSDARMFAKEAGTRLDTEGLALFGIEADDLGRLLGIGGRQKNRTAIVIE